MKGRINIIDLVTENNDKKYEPAGRMAEAIIAISERNGGCLPQDLNECGFSREEVGKHYHMAQSLAAVELGLMSKNRSSDR